MLVASEPPDTPPALVGPAGDGPLVDILRFVVGHPLLLAAIFLPIAVAFGWRQLRQYYLTAKGRPLPPLGFTISRVLRFAFLEDRGPVLSRPAFAARMQWRYLYLLSFTVVVLLAVQAARDDIAVTRPFVAVSEVTLLLGAVAVFALVFIPRARKVFRLRHMMMMQMFDLAGSEMKYPKDATFNPWAWVRITRWEGTTRPTETHIRFPAGYHSEDTSVREKFERNFSGSVSDENSFKFQWDSPRNLVTATPTPYLPRYAQHPGPSVRPWNEIPLGITWGGEEAILDVLVTPHLLVAGPTGSGKSIVQRTILTTLLAHPHVRVIGIDPKMVELSPYEDATNMITLAKTLEEATQVLESAEAEMKRRYKMMTELGVNHASQLPADPETGQQPPALFILIDEAYALLAPEKIRSDEGKARDEMHARCTVLISSIARLGRASSIHLVIATQRPDSSQGVLPGELRNNLDARIACSRLDQTPSLMVLDSTHACRLPLIKGRSVLRLGGDYKEYQGYFLEQADVVPWAEQMLAAHLAGSAEDATFTRQSDDVIEGELIEAGDVPTDPATPMEISDPPPAQGGGLRGWWARRAHAAASWDADLKQQQDTHPPVKLSGPTVTRRRKKPAAAPATDGATAGSPLLMPTGFERSVVTSPWAGSGSGWQSPGPRPPQITDQQSLDGAVQPSMFPTLDGAADPPAAPTTPYPSAAPTAPYPASSPLPPAPQTAPGAGLGPLPTAPVTRRLVPTP